MGADVMTYGVFHLGCLGPIRMHPVDMKTKGRVGDLQRLDLLAEVENRDMLVDQTPDLLLVLVGIEVPIGCVAVAAPSSHLDLTEEVDIPHERQRFRSRQDSVEGGEEGSYCNIELGPESFVAEQLNAGFDRFVGRGRFDAALDEELSDALALGFELVDFGGERPECPVNVRVDDLAVSIGISGESLGELSRHAVVIDDQSVRLFRCGPVDASDRLEQFSLLDQSIEIENLRLWCVEPGEQHRLDNQQRKGAVFVVSGPEREFEAVDMCLLTLFAGPWGVIRRIVVIFGDHRGKLEAA